MSVQMLLAVLATPLAAALGILVCGRWPDLREGVSLVAAVVLFACLLTLLPIALAGDMPRVELLEILPGLALAFHVEPLGIGFALVVAFLWFWTILYAVGYMRAHHEVNQTRFYTFFAIAIAATIGGALAANMLTLYLFYEALTLATYPLVTHGGEDKDRAGGRTYLAVLLGTSLTFLLVAMIWTWLTVGSLEFVPGGQFAATGASPVLVAVLYGLFLFGTGKAALLPFHRWLPAAMVAPTPVSALLHAVAVVKLGVFTVLKVTVYLFGIDTLARLDATLVMKYVAAATLLYTAVRAVFEDNLKRRLAFSTISQLAYVVLAATLVTDVAVTAGALHIAAHAFAKITLFFCAGMILVALHKTQVSEMRGIARRMPVTMAAWCVAGASVIGMPFTAGFWSKWNLALGTWEAGEPLLLAVVLLGSLLAVGYLVPPALAAYRAAPEDADHHGEAAAGRFEAPLPSLIALVVTAAMAVLLFFAADPMVTLLDGVGR